MQPQDKIGKSSWMIQESIKDTVDQTVVAAVKGGQIKIDQTQLPVLLLVLHSAIEAGYGKAFKVFMREVADALATKEKPKKK